MNYLQFKKQVVNMPLIVSRDLTRFKKDAQALRNQLNRWRHRKLLMKLKKGVYILNEADRIINPGRVFIANQLYWPSYVSLEYAFGVYGLIPERVADITSVTTKKTVSFTNELGTFTYQHIQPVAYRGIQESKDDTGLNSFIAEPEKAVVDWLYFNLKKISAAPRDIFQKSYRFQNTSLLKPRRIMELAKLFHNHKLLGAAKNFCEFIKEEGAE